MTSESEKQIFGHFYRLTDNALIPGNSDISFSDNSYPIGFEHTKNDTQIIILTEGDYLINYSIATSKGTGSILSISVNNIVNPATSLSVFTGYTSGVVILSLKQGDILTLRNNTSTPLTLTAPPCVSAQITIKKLSQ